MGNSVSLKLATLAGVAALTVACTSTPEKTASDAQNLVTEAQTTLSNFERDPDMTWFRNNAKKAKAVLIAPAVYKAGFILGGSGGRAVLVARDTATGAWAGPAFYTLATGSVGFQAGVDVSEVVMLFMSDKALNSVLSTSFKLGGDVSVSAGPVGQGAMSDITTDVVTFARSKGVYLGLNLDGTVVKTSDEYDGGYYGRTVTPPDILIRHAVSNAHADPLRKEVARVAGSK
jgi:SH3 domain-containing YSC84-like protein 1